MQLVPWFWTLVNTCSNLLTHVFVRRRVIVVGEPPRGPVLVCAKHASGWDIPLLSHQCRRLCGLRPFFQMGSFVGYPVLGRLVPFMKRLGGFPVMRPKEILRLRKRAGWDRARARAHMEEVNAEAADTRLAVLRSGGALVVFPEGTRDDERVLELVSELEIRTALELVREGLEIDVWPVVISFGRRRRLRRPAVVEFRPPFKLTAAEPRDVLDALAAEYQRHWRPREAVDDPRALGPAEERPRVAPEEARSASNE